MKIEQYRPVHITPRGLFRAFLVVLAVLLLAAWVQTMTVFRPQMLELSARADRQLAEANELLDQAKEMQEGKP